MHFIKLPLKKTSFKDGRTVTVPVRKLFGVVLISLNYSLAKKLMVQVFWSDCKSLLGCFSDPEPELGKTFDEILNQDS